MSRSRSWSNLVPRTPAAASTSRSPHRGRALVAVCAVLFALGCSDSGSNKSGDDNSGNNTSGNTNGDNAANSPSGACVTYAPGEWSVSIVPEDGENGEPLSLSGGCVYVSAGGERSYHQYVGSVTGNESNEFSLMIGYLLGLEIPKFEVTPGEHPSGQISVDFQDSHGVMCQNAAAYAADTDPPLTANVITVDPINLTFEGRITCVAGGQTTYRATASGSFKASPR